jgi:hypothetical protein
MKKEHYIYLIFWGPLLFLSLILIFSISTYKKSLKPLPEIGFSSNYMEMLNQLNSLKFLKPINFVASYNLIKDPFHLPMKKSLTLSPVFPTKIIRLNMIYIENNKKICIINNKRFKEGDYIEKGIKLLKIGDYYADLQIKNQVKRLFIGQSFSL